MNLLVSSQDYGSALQNKAFIDYFLDENISANVYLYFSGKCQGIYSDLENHSRTYFINDKFFLVNNVDINFALVGLSEDEHSVDKISTQFALTNKIPVGVIQDIWGNIGHFGQTKLPDFFFVIDDDAKELTLLKTTGKANCIITGSPKHSNYAKLSTNESKCKLNSILFCLQPLHLSGIINNFFYFLKFLSDINHNFQLHIKLHPDDYSAVDDVDKWIKNFDQTAEIFTDSNIIYLLHQAQLVVTCFSTIGLDHNYLNGFSKQPLGNLIYMNLGPDIRNHIKTQIGAKVIPGVSRGLGGVITDESQGMRQLKRGLFDKKLATDYHQKCQEICQYSLNSNKMINDSINKWKVG